MKKSILTLICWCFAMLLQAADSKAKAVVVGSSSAATDTIKSNVLFETPGRIEAIPPVPYHENRNDLNLERNFESDRIELERQTIEEMENYRSEILVRLIKEEYFRLINDKMPDLTDSNRAIISRLAKYRTLRDLLYEQSSKRNRPALPGTAGNNLPLNSPTELDNMVQQLDVKIREEEQRVEMFTRQRMEMERRMEQENLNQNQNQNRNQPGTNN